MYPVRRVPNSQCQVQELGSAEDGERIRTVKLIAKLDAKSDSESSMFETPGAALLWMELQRSRAVQGHPIGLPLERGAGFSKFGPRWRRKL